MKWHLVNGAKLVGDETKYDTYFGGFQGNAKGKHSEKWMA